MQAKERRNVSIALVEKSHIYRDKRTPKIFHERSNIRSLIFRYPDMYPNQNLRNHGRISHKQTQKVIFFQELLSSTSTHVRLL
ncbi:uncharacterized protein DS421_10g309600 [Arachis hypogaea]|nr:uncharacterized protein DS421_10g309600 [Arachis hypogaea]